MIRCLGSFIIIGMFCLRLIEIVYAENMSVFTEGRVFLREQEFELSREHRDISDVVVVVTETGVERTIGELTGHIASNLQKYAAITLPAIEIRESNAAEVIYAVVALTKPEKVKISIGKKLSIAHEYKEVNQSLPLWVDACNLEGVRVRVEKLENVLYLELLHHLATALELEIGVLHSGDLILGRRGSWLPNYKPAYTLKLKTRRVP